MRRLLGFLRTFVILRLPPAPAPLPIMTVDELQAMCAPQAAQDKSYAAAVERQRLTASDRQASAQIRLNGGSTVVSMQEWRRRKSRATSKE